MAIVLRMRVPHFVCDKDGSIGSGEGSSTLSLTMRDNRRRGMDGRFESPRRRTVRIRRLDRERVYHDRSLSRRALSHRCETSLSSLEILVDLKKYYQVGKQ